MRIISPTKVVIERNTPNINNVLYFETNKKTESTYHIKENDINLIIHTKTNNIKIEKKRIKIEYTILDSNNDYEYYIEMSE